MPGIARMFAQVGSSPGMLIGTQWGGGRRSRPKLWISLDYDKEYGIVGIKLTWPALSYVYTCFAGRWALHLYKKYLE